jgi:transposase InsO family protein
LADRLISAGIIHHSDQGVQYASKDYVKTLLALGFRISMSRKASSWENARAEAFMKILKSEEADLRQYRDLEDARNSIAHFIEHVYNPTRLHSALLWDICHPPRSNHRSQTLRFLIDSLLQVFEAALMAHGSR